MAILEQDLKLVHAEEDSDFDTGGGALTTTEIVDGALHNLFDATAELDEAQGRIKVRKFGAVVDTATTDRLQAAHLLITETPSNPLLAATLFSTRNDFDRRPDHAAYIESYYVPGGRFGGYLYGTQVAGARAVDLWLRAGAALPEAGTTYVLIEDEGLASETHQYILVTDVATRAEAHSDSQGAYTVTVATLSLSTRLEHAFHGPEPSRTDPAAASYAGLMRRVVVAEAAQYYSARPTTAAAAAGTMEIEVDTIYQPLVPAATLPVAHADVDPAAHDTTLVPGNAGTVSFTTPAAFGAGAVLYLGTPFLPGTLSIAAGAATLRDNGAGTLYSGSTAIGTVDYAAGTVTAGAMAPTYAGTKTVTLQPAGALTGPKQTAAIEVTLATRSQTYVLTLPTQPQPGSTRVAYKSLDRWYDLADRGDGVCVGSDSAYGAASVRFSTRTLTISLGALPDVDSWILIVWGEATYTFSRGGSTLDKAAFEFETAAAPVPNGTTITWSDGAARTAIDNGAGGLTGDATGTVAYSGKKLVIRPNLLPSVNTVFTVAMGPKLTASESFASAPRDGNGRFTVTLAHVPAAGTVEVDLQFASPFWSNGTNLYKTLTFKDDGAGGMPDLAYASINYAAKTLTLNPTVDVVKLSPGTFLVAGRWVVQYVGYGATPRTHPLTANIVVRYAYGDALNAVSETFTAAHLAVDVTPQAEEECVPNSLRLAVGGKTYLDQNGGLYTDVNPATGAGTFAGTLDNATGRAALTVWAAGQANAPTLPALVTRAGTEAVDEITFRAPGAPVQVGSVQLVATDTAGNALSATANTSGVFSATGISGKFYHAAGVGRVRFGDLVTAAGHESEAWYDASAVVGGQIWKPRLVLSSTIRFNCVTTTYLPVDSAVLGLASERLPANGQVPIFDAGRLVAIHHTLTTTVTSPTAGATHSTGRTYLERIWVRDSTGQRLPADRYTANLDTGVLTWAAPLNLAGYVGPFTIYNRIMHKCRLASADLSGRLALRLPLNADYPAGSIVSAVLPCGDLQGRVERLFEQTAWIAGSDGSYWASSVTGSTPAAQYDSTQYPVEVSNRSSRDRYAIIFTSASQFRVLSEHRGELARDISKNADFTLTNSLTGEPEFTLRAAGWGGGWSVGNVLRFDVTGAKFPAEIALTIQEGVHDGSVDRLTVEFMGDI